MAQAARSAVTAASPERWSTAASSQPAAPRRVSSGSPTGTFTIIGNLLNQGAIQLASGESIGNVLEVRGAYVGAGGSMAINTFLGSDGSPSDRLVINGDPAATGSTSVHVTNVGGPGVLTTANGILVVNASNGATTAPGAFTLSNGRVARRRFRLSSVSRRRLWQSRRLVPALELHRAADFLQSRRRAPRASVPDHRAGARHLWGGPASRPTVGSYDPRHARRPGRRHLRPRRLRGGARARGDRG